MASELKPAELQKLVNNLAMATKEEELNKNSWIKHVELHVALVLQKEAREWFYVHVQLSLITRSTIRTQFIYFSISFEC